jgi:hypothetical protein
MKTGSIARWKRFTIRHIRKRKTKISRARQANYMRSKPNSAKESFCLGLASGSDPRCAQLTDMSSTRNVVTDALSVRQWNASITVWPANAERSTVTGK